TLVSYIETYGDENLVVLVLGDHQPAPMVSGDPEGKQVPIHLIRMTRQSLLPLQTGNGNRAYCLTTQRRCGAWTNCVTVLSRRSPQRAILLNQKSKTCVSPADNSNT